MTGVPAVSARPPTASLAPRTLLCGMPAKGRILLDE